MDLFFTTTTILIFINLRDRISLPFQELKKTRNLNCRASLNTLKT